MQPRIGCQGVRLGMDAFRRPAAAFRAVTARVVLLVLLPVILSGCIVGEAMESVDKPSMTSSWVRPDDPQEQIGEREHPVVLAKYGGEYRHEGAERLLAVIVGRLVAVSQDQSRTYKVTILNSPKVNAFALPGGYLYVTRGLLALANDTAELAAVIAHEMAHVSANHSILRNQKEHSDQLGKEVVSEVLGGSVAGQVALAANRIRLSDFSKEQELQADTIGIRMLGEAGFDAHAAARFLETMQAYQALNSAASGQIADITFLSSHPATPQRIELARKHARFFGAPGTGEADHERYLTGIDGMLYGDSAEEGFVRDNRFSHLGLGVTFSGPPGVRLENQATAVVVNGPGEIATRFDAAVLPRGQDLANYMKSGWVKGLDESTIETGPMNGLNSAHAVAKGGKWEFVIRIFQLDRQVYRFITAGPAGDPAIEPVSREIAGSFRRMNEAEKAGLQPLRIEAVRVGPEDSLGSLAARMQVGANQVRLFQVLNSLAPGEIPQAGSRVKIVAGGKG